MKYLKPIELYRESFNKRPGLLMGLTVGQNNLGISFSDDSKTTASRAMSKTIVRTKESVSAVQDLIQKHLVSGLVIGYPFLFEKQHSPTAGRVAKSFLDYLNRSNFEHVNYTLWDESYTTKIRVQLIKKLSESYNPPRNYTLEEDYAAYEMLEAYLYYIINPREHPKGFNMINRDNPFEGSQACKAEEQRNIKDIP